MRGKPTFRLLEERALSPGTRSYSPQIAGSLVHGFPYRTEIRGAKSCVNAISLDSDGKFLLAGGDDRRVLLFDLGDDVTALRPTKAFPGHQSNIFVNVFTPDVQRIYSSGNDGLIVKHSVEKGLESVILAHDDGCLSISLDPRNDKCLLSTGHDGAVKLWDMRDDEAAGEMLFPHEMNSVAWSSAPNVFAAAGNHSDLALYDARMCFSSSSRRDRALVRYNLRLFSRAQNRHAKSLDVTNVAFSPSGKYLAASVSKWLPTLFATGEPLPVCVLDHKPDADAPPDAPRYRNSCTVKTCKFASYAGKELFLSGSDDFSAFAWALPATFPTGEAARPLEDIGFTHAGGIHYPHAIDKANHVLLGARSITNSAIMHPTLPFIFTAGVEKVVRLHSAVPLDDRPPDPAPQKRTSHVADPERRRRVLRDIIEGDGMVAEEETELGEDERTLGFFDFLLSREGRRFGETGTLTDAMLLPEGEGPESDSSEDEDDDESADTEEFESWLMEGAEDDDQSGGEGSDGSDGSSDDPSDARVKRRRRIGDL
ncbi:WD40-repeat-containing domain protein [Hyaloraphidium curvatum]|nr:WD40-repeat-containing domain protein [Hyaloraphidium curvatum]